MDTGAGDSDTAARSIPQQGSASVPRSATPSTSSNSEPATDFAPIRSESSAATRRARSEPTIKKQLTEDGLFGALSHPRSPRSGPGHETEDDEESAQIQKLVSRMFGRDRKANSEEEKTRHAGIV